MSVPRFGWGKDFKHGFAFIGQPPVVAYSFNHKEWAIIGLICTFSPSDQFEAVKRSAMNIAVN
jgi:hypothetical protein